MSERGIFITFEGPDGSGKTTQIALLADWLRSLGVKPVVLRQPGGTALGERIRATLLDTRAGGNVAPLAELALMFADRAQSIDEIIQPALAAGQVVLCDRYTDSSEAYQGAGRGLGSERVLALHNALCDNLEPDLTILLLPDPEVALARARARNALHHVSSGVDENRFEAEDDAFYRRVHAGYQALAAREPHRVYVINEGGVEAVAARIQTLLGERFPTLLAARSGV